MVSTLPYTAPSRFLRSSVVEPHRTCQVRCTVGSMLTAESQNLGLKFRVLIRGSCPVSTLPELPQPSSLLSHSAKRMAHGVRTTRALWFSVFTMLLLIP